MKTPLSIYALSGLVGAIGVAPLAAGQSQAPVVSPSSTPAKFSLVDAPRHPTTLDRAPAGWSGSSLDMECGSLELTQSTDPALIGAGSVWCGTLDFNSETRLARAFTAPHDLSLKCVTFAVRENRGADWPCEVRVLLGGTATPYSELTLLTQTMVNIPDGTDREMFTAEMPATSIPSGAEFIIELVTPTRDPSAGGDGGLLALGFNSAGESAPSYIYAEECGLSEYQTLASIGFPNRHLVLSVGIDPDLPTQQYGWIIEIDNPTLGPIGSGLPQETQITLFATFDSAVHYAMAGGEFDLVASEPGSAPGNWHSNEVLPPLDSAAAYAGVLTETGATGAFPAQLHYPPFGFFGDPVNPAPAWRITYTATDFTARSIDLETVTSRFFATDELGRTHEIPVASVTEGAAQITIVAGCYADCDGSGALDFFDFLCFQNEFSAGCP